MCLKRDTWTLHMMEKDKKTPDDRLVILAKEISFAAYAFLQAKIFKEESSALRANGILELGDAMVQMEMLCHDLGLDPKDVLQQGIQHTFERFQDFERRGWGKR